MALTQQELAELTRNSGFISSDKIAEIQDIADKYPYFQLPYLLLAKINSNTENLQNAAVRTANRAFMKFYIEGEKFSMPDVQGTSGIDQVDLYPDNTNAFHILGKDNASHEVETMSSFDPETDTVEASHENIIQHTTISENYFERQPNNDLSTETATVEEPASFDFRAPDTDFTDVIERTEYNPFDDKQATDAVDSERENYDILPTTKSETNFDELVSTYEDPYKDVEFEETTSSYSEILKMQQAFLNDPTTYSATPKPEESETRVSQAETEVKKGVWIDTDKDGNPEFYEIKKFEFADQDVSMKDHLEKGVWIDTDGDGELEFFQGKFVEDDEANPLSPEEVAKGYWADTDGDGELEFFQGKFVEHDDAHPLSAEEVAQGVWIDTDGDGTPEFYAIKKFDGDENLSLQDKLKQGVWIDTDGDGELEFFQGKFVEDDEANPLSPEEVAKGYWADTDGDGELEFFQGKFVEHDDAHPVSAEEVAQGVWIDTDGDGTAEFYAIKKFDGDENLSLEEKIKQGVWIDTDGDGELEFFKKDSEPERETMPDITLHNPKPQTLQTDDVFGKTGEVERKSFKEENYFGKFGIDKEETD
jgi:hypothetical protein